MELKAANSLIAVTQEGDILRVEIPAAGINPVGAVKPAVQDYLGIVSRSVILVRLLTILLLLSGCATDTRQYQAEVIRNMMFAGYDMRNLEHNPKVIIDRCENMPCESSGCYDLGTKTIYICKDIAKMIKHEYGHFYAHQLKIPLAEHHKLLRKLGY